MVTQSSWLSTREDLGKAKHLGASPAGLVTGILDFDNSETRRLLAWSANSGQNSRYVNSPKHSVSDKQGVSSEYRSYHLAGIHAHVRLNQIAEDIYPIFKDFFDDCEAARQVFNAKLGFSSNGAGDRLYYTTDYRGMLTEAKRLHESGYKFVAKFDIKKFFPSLTSSFFESHLGDLPKFIPLSLQMDLSLTLRETRNGLPINCVGSQLLARLALIPLDTALRDRGYKFVRYQDDLWVYCQTHGEMLEAAVVVRNVLCTLGLKCTDYKTELLQPARSKFLHFGLMPNGIPLESYFDIEEEESCGQSVPGPETIGRDKGYQECGSSLTRSKIVSILKPTLYQEYIAPGMCNPSHSVEKFVFEHPTIFGVPADGACLNDAGEILKLRHADLGVLSEQFPESTVFLNFHEPVMESFHVAKEGFLVDYIGVLRNGVKQQCWERMESQVAADKALAPLVLFRAQAGVFQIEREKHGSSSLSSFHHVASDALYLIRSLGTGSRALRNIKDHHSVGGLVVEALEMVA